MSNFCNVGVKKSLKLSYLSHNIQIIGFFQMTIGDAMCAS